jgi:hypothetical protein
MEAEEITMSNKLLILLIGVAIGMVMASGCISSYHSRTLSTQLSDERIVSLDLGNQLHGSFFLGTGSINERTYYYYYRAEADGSYTLQKAPADFSKIFMDTTPAMAHIITLNGDLYPYNCRDGLSDIQCKLAGDEYVWFKTYEFHVPVGTIIERYNANVGSA